MERGEFEIRKKRKREILLRMKKKKLFIYFKEYNLKIQNQ